MPRKLVKPQSILPDKPSSLLDTRVIYCGDNLDQLKKLPDACVDLIGTGSRHFGIDPAPVSAVELPFNSNCNYEVFWGETKKKRAFGARRGEQLRQRDHMEMTVSVGALMEAGFDV